MTPVVDDTPDCPRDFESPQGQTLAAKGGREACQSARQLCQCLIFAHFSTVLDPFPLAAEASNILAPRRVARSPLARLSALH